ncbi:hypothetical protein [Corynebacterium sp.]|uniref:hypothetical protein n=1 Tax=Corynebacterium sp. TaxID=1720 RepID=UPI0026DAF033|nr:hypothetical protein [Corynebacterium sp.]MDO5032676.1 hypothetical protein [Corynebacterium sp.]
MAGDNQGGGSGNGFGGPTGPNSWQQPSPQQPQRPNTHPETTSFGPVGPDNGQQRNPFEGPEQFGATPMYQNQGPAAQYAGQYAQPPAQKTSMAPIIAAIVVVLLLLIGGGVGAYFIFGKSSGSQDASAPMSTQAPANTGDGSSDSENTTTKREPTTSKAESRPEYPSLPGYAVAANESARSNKPGGDFNNVYMGSSVTSEPFANAVRDAYVRHYLDTEELDATLDVFSTVTGQTYTMSCRDNGKYVTCTGGNNAIVYIV